jgi:hypothetical protein
MNVEFTIAVFWDMTPCSLVYSEDEDKNFLWNPGKLPLKYTP